MSAVDDAGAAVVRTSAAFKASRQAIIDAQVALVNAKSNFVVQQAAYNAAIAAMLALVHGADDQSAPAPDTRKPI